MKLYKHIEKILKKRKRITLSREGREDEVVKVVEGLFRDTTEWDILWFNNFNSPEEFRACYCIVFLRWVAKLTSEDLKDYFTEHELMELFSE